jgi:hypothetical protein
LRGSALVETIWFCWYSCLRVHFSSIPIHIPLLEGRGQFHDYAYTYAYPHTHPTPMSIMVLTEWSWEGCWRPCFNGVMLSIHFMHPPTTRMKKDDG